MDEYYAATHTQQRRSHVLCFQIVRKGVEFQIRKVLNIFAYLLNKLLMQLQDPFVACFKWIQLENQIFCTKTLL